VHIQPVSRILGGIGGGRRRPVFLGRRLRCILCRDHDCSDTQKAEKSNGRYPNVFSCVHVSHSFAASLPRLLCVLMSEFLPPHFIPRQGGNFQSFRQWPSRTMLRFQFGTWTTRLRVPLGTLWQLRRLLGVRPGANESSSSSASVISEIVSSPSRTM